jgi:hypothetical protein
MTRPGLFEAFRQFRRLAGVFLSDPLEAVRLVPEGVTGYFEHPVDYDVDEDWEPRLHRMLDMPWPCAARRRGEQLWETVAGELRERGYAFGRHTYGHYSDADAALARAVWCTVVHLRPDTIVETGVARGITSRVILEALEENGRGRLSSVDLPHPFERALRSETGIAVPPRLWPRWSYIKGSSRRRLPGLLRGLRQVDVFVHDSLHTARNTRFEMGRVGRVLAPGGVMLVDDISTHQGFDSWVRAAPGARALVCPSDDGEGLFGVVSGSPAEVPVPGAVPRCP